MPQRIDSKPHESDRDHPQAQKHKLAEQILATVNDLLIDELSIGWFVGFRLCGVQCEIRGWFGRSLWWRSDQEARGASMEFERVSSFSNQQPCEDAWLTLARETI